MVSAPEAKLSISNLSPELRRAAKEARYREDFPLFMYEQGIVDIRGVGTAPFRDHIWPFQMSFAELLVREPRLVVLKARQLGVSTILMHFAYHAIRFGAPNSQHILVLSKSKDDAAYILEKVPEINNHMDQDLQLDAVTDQTFRFTLSNGNTIECVASTEGGGRSRAATKVVLDEHAFHNFAEKNWNAVKPTLDGGGNMIVVSTANGMGNLFHTLYEKAKLQQDIDSKSFKAVFIPYDAASHRDALWREREKAEHVGDEQLFNQEYPRSDSEAFAKTGTCPFDAQYISEQVVESEGRPPIQRMHDGRSRIWVRPQAGMLYAAGLDCMQGVSENKNVDYHSLKIIDQGGGHVASYESQAEIGAAAREIHELLVAFNTPMLVVERNSAGVGFIAALQSLGYRNFYRYNRRHFEFDAPEPHDGKLLIGVQMTQTTKRLVVQNLVGKVNSRALRSSDTSFWRQCINFTQKGPNKWGAQSGHDDEVIGMGWAVWGLSFLYRPVSKRRKKIRWA